MKRESTYALSFLVLLLSSILFFNLVYPFDPQFLSRFAFLSSSYVTLNNSQNSPLTGGCDYSRGRWVWDETYPRQLYGENCPFLDPGFRCRRNGRKNERFRKWRWQPDGCDIPRYVIHVCIMSCTLATYCMHLAWLYACYVRIIDQFSDSLCRVCLIFSLKIHLGVEVLLESKFILVTCLVTPKSVFALKFLS